MNSSFALLTPLLNKIQTTYNPKQVWLFGSRARGDARPDSDWDIFVVVDDKTPEERLDPLIAWSLQKSTNVYADIVPCRWRDFCEHRAVTNSLPYEVARDGVLLYEC